MKSFIWNMTLHFNVREYSHETSQYTVQQPFFFLKTLCHTSLFISVMLEFTERWRHKAWLRQLCIFNGAAMSVVSSCISMMSYITSHLCSFTLIHYYPTFTDILVWVLSSFCFFMYHIGNLLFGLLQSAVAVIYVSCLCSTRCIQEGTL